MRITTVRLYHPAPWGWLYSYQALLVTLRMLELWFIALRFLFFRGPLLLVWTRLPVLRDTRPPYGGLAEVLAPTKERASLKVGEGQLGSDLALAQNAGDVFDIRTAFLAEVERPSRVWSIVGCILRGFLTDLGPIFIKFGQIMSMRTEIPPSVRAELQLLQDKMPSMDYQEVRRILEKELGRPVDEVFEYVEKRPVAAASLAQVHRAKLRKEQEEVALKIQRPYLEEMVAIDSVIICDVLIGIVTTLLPLLDKSTDVSVFTSSFRKSLKKEINFLIEERSQERCRQILINHPIYSQMSKIARTYRGYCTRKLLTMEFVKGLHRWDRLMDELTTEQIWEVTSLQIEGYPKDRPLQLLWAQIAMLADGLMRWDWHGDLHLGNLYLMEPEKGEGWRMFICDFGMMIEAIPEERGALDKMIVAIMYHSDGQKLMEAIEEINLEPLGPRSKEQLQFATSQLADEYMLQTAPDQERLVQMKYQRGVSQHLMSSIVYSMVTVGMRFPDWFWLVCKNLDYGVNMCQTFWTSFDASPMFAAGCKKWVKEEILIDLEEKDITNLRESLPELLDHLRPYDRAQVLNALSTGEEVKAMRIMEHRGWDVRFLKESRPFELNPLESIQLPIQESSDQQSSIHP